MGKQHNKVIKRRRRKAYLERKATRRKAGIARLPSTRPKGAADDAGDVKPAKKAAKKAAVKKVAKKKEETAAVETPVATEATAPDAES